MKMTHTRQSSVLVLMVDDDHFFGKTLKKSLENDFGFEVHHVLDGYTAWETFKKKHFDICLVDVIMPGLDGFDLTKKIRTVNESVPILFTSCRGMAEDRIMALSIGGDDYLVKPFHIEELTLKMKNLLRRSTAHKTWHRTLYCVGDYTLNMMRDTLTRNGVSADLSRLEVKVLLLLLQQAGEIVSREEIMQEVWGRTDFITGRTLDVLISRLRKRFKSDPQHVYIDAVRNQGYRLTAVDKIS